MRIWIGMAIILIAFIVSACGLSRTASTSPIYTGKPRTPAESQAADQVLLRRFGIGFLVAGIVALAAGIFFANQLGTTADWLRSGGATGIFSGSLLIVIAAFVVVFYWLIGAIIALGVVSGGLWVWLHRTDILPYFGKTSAAVAVCLTILCLGRPANADQIYNYSGYFLTQPTTVNTQFSGPVGVASPLLWGQVLAISDAVEEMAYSPGRYVQEDLIDHVNLSWNGGQTAVTHWGVEADEWATARQLSYQLFNPHRDSFVIFDSDGDDTKKVDLFTKFAGTGSLVYIFPNAHGTLEFDVDIDIPETHLPTIIAPDALVVLRGLNGVILHEDGAVWSRGLNSSNATIGMQTTSIPEPASLFLLLGGVLAFLGRLWK